MGIEPPQSPESLGETPPRESKQACGVAFAFGALTLRGSAGLRGRHLSHATWEPRAAGVCLGQLIRQQESLLGPPIFP